MAGRRNGHEDNICTLKSTPQVKENSQEQDHLRKQEHSYWICGICVWDQSSFGDSVLCVCAFQKFRLGCLGWKLWMGPCCWTTTSDTKHQKHSVFWRCLQWTTWYVQRISEGFPCSQTLANWTVIKSFYCLICDAAWHHVAPLTPKLRGKGFGSRFRLQLGSHIARAWASHVLKWW